MANFPVVYESLLVSAIVIVAGVIHVGILIEIVIIV